MKKIIACLLALVLCFAMATTAMAVEVGFTPSVEEKPGPGIVPDGDIIGAVYGPDGSILDYAYKGDIIITPIAQVNTSTEIPEDARQELIEQNKILNADGTKLSELCPGLNDMAANALGAGKNADDLVIRDLFDVSITDPELKALVEIDGNKLELTYNLGIGADEFITAMVYVDGKWVVVETVNNGDGTVTCLFEDVCPVAFVVADTYADGPSQTGDAANVTLWVAAAVISLVAIVALVVVYRRDAAKNR